MPPSPRSSPLLPLAQPSPSSRPRPEDSALLALQNDLHRFEHSQRSQERALWLLFIEGPGVAPFCERLLRRRLVIGRDAGCSLPLLGETMAPQHALLEHDDGSDHWAVVPVSNTHSTFVNGKRVYGRTPLGPEDRVQVGPWLLRIGVEGDDEWHQKLRFATLHSTPGVPGLAQGSSAKPDRLIVLSGPVPAKEIRLDEGPVRLGPVKGSSLVPEPGALVDLNVEVSPMPDGRYELVSFNEGASVSVNGVSERRVVLSPGDRLRLGGGSGAAYLVFAGRVPDADGPPTGKKLNEISGVRSVKTPFAPPIAPSSNAPAPESEAVWSMQAMGLESAPPTPTPTSWLEPPALDDEAFEEDEATRAAKPPAAPRRRSPSPTAMLVIATGLLLGLFVLGVTSLLRGRQPESAALADGEPADAKTTQALRPAAEAGRAATPPATNEGRPIVVAAIDEPAAPPPPAAALPPPPATTQAPAPTPPTAATPAATSPPAAEAPSRAERTAELPPAGAAATAKAAATESHAATATAAPRPAPPATAPKPIAVSELPHAPSPPRPPVVKEAPRPAGDSSQCDRLRALQRSGRATPDDERMLQRCH